MVERDFRVLAPAQWLSDRPWGCVCAPLGLTDKLLATLERLGTSPGSAAERAAEFAAVETALPFAVVVTRGPEPMVYASPAFGSLYIGGGGRIAISEADLGVHGKERLNLAALEYYLLSERERLPFNAFVTGVQHVPAGWFLRLGPGESQPSWPRTSREPTTYESFLRAWRTAVSLMAAEATAADGEISLGFSGGVDSRFILGLLTELGIPTRLLHMPTGNQRQTQLAVAIARRLGQRLEIVLPPLRLQKERLAFVSTADTKNFYPGTSYRMHVLMAETARAPNLVHGDAMDQMYMIHNFSVEKSTNESEFCERVSRQRQFLGASLAAKRTGCAFDKIAEGLFLSSKPSDLCSQFRDRQLIASVRLREAIRHSVAEVRRAADSTATGEPEADANYAFRLAAYVRTRSPASASFTAFAALSQSRVFRPAVMPSVLDQYLNLMLREEDLAKSRRYQYRYLDGLGEPWNVVERRKPKSATRKNVSTRQLRDRLVLRRLDRQIRTRGFRWVPREMLERVDLTDPKVLRRAHHLDVLLEQLVAKPTKSSGGHWYGTRRKEKASHVSTR